MTTLLLGIDVGTTGTKAALFTPDGQLLAVGQADYGVQPLRPGWVEQSPEDWWQATCHAVQQALAAVPGGADRVGGVAVSSQAPALLALDGAGQPLRPALIWMDRRAEAEVAELNELVGADNIFRITGNRTDAFYVAPKLRWFKNNEPQLFAQAKTFLQINGYIAYRLSGTFSLDPGHAALLQLRNYQTGEWSASLCEACGVEPEQFPPIYPSEYTQGEVTAQAAEQTGLRAGTPVMVGSVDASAAAIEAGAVMPGSAAEMTGTSTVLLMPTAGNVTEPAFIAMPHALPNLHLLLGAMVASGASLTWFRDQFGQLERSAAEQLNLNAFDLLTAQAESAPVGSDGVIFLPYMMGERAPIWHSNARGVFFGLSLATSKAAVVRSLLEGTAYALRHNVDVAQLAGLRMTEIRSVGGGTRSNLWNQIKADILGMPILLPQTSVGAPFGDAVLVGMGLGLYPNLQEAITNMVKVKVRYEPDPINHTRYSEIYTIYRKIYGQLRDVFDQAALVSEEMP